MEAVEQYLTGRESFTTTPSSTRSFKQRRI